VSWLLLLLSPDVLLLATLLPEPAVPLLAVLLLPVLLLG
jgi:hypothetical protein